MKKILTLLATTTLIASSSASVIACVDPDEGGNGNGGGEKPDPEVETYSLDEVFLDTEIDEIKTTFDPNGSSGQKSIYLWMQIDLLNKAFKNENSKIKKIGQPQSDIESVLAELAYLYSSGQNENYNKLNNLKEELEKGENIIENFKFNMDIIHADILEANSSNLKSAKKLVSKLQEGTIEITVKKLILKVF
ncbi:lipoprotein [Spiroplasma diminutum]|uniref:Lipoprotein n=1 Tax=Spiroplasma diminutum CUAS-1 TaxID=1276221 RepID=S5MEW4_9MOLU|nr:lipoprotein [Spiroplasma diminutum]AGR42313.1 hypothetical protein SDIMI_v3c06090 [Spiroplasma diminutum CUAS-1]